MTTVLLGALLIAVSAGRVTAGATPIRIACRDAGTRAVVQGFGRRRTLDGICDLDASCDGICTLDLPSARAARCLLVGGPDCELHGSQPDFVADAGSHCAKTARWGVPRHASTAQRRFPGFSVRCLRPKACPPTSTTVVPSGVPDLTGDWTVLEVESRDDCPAAVGVAVAFARLRDAHQLRLVQIRTRVFDCGGDALVTSLLEGTVSGDGFAFDTGDCCSIGDYDLPLAQEFSASLPGENGTVRVTEEWTVSTGSASAAVPICRRTAEAVMARVTRTCDSDLECLEVGGCDRCIGGICLPAPACR